MWCNIHRQLSSGFTINRMIRIAEQCGHCQRHGPLTFLPDSHIQGEVVELVIPSLSGFPDTESGMKIHLPLSWLLAGAGLLLGFPGWKIISPSSNYISRAVRRDSVGPTPGTHPTGENHRGTAANMMMLKVEELVCEMP